jgi:hypothetical protein
MKSTFLAIALMLLTNACATPTSSKAPACSGPRRPANPNGSVLSAPDAPAAAAPAPAAPCGGGAR